MKKKLSPRPVPAHLFSIYDTKTRRADYEKRPANCPVINVTEAAQNENLYSQPQAHCLINTVTERASLKSTKSQGGDEVVGASKWAYVRKMSERYQSASRVEKHLILDELEKNLEIHRKSAIRALGSVRAKSPKETRGRQRIYNDFVIQHLRVLWIDMGQLCSRRMKKALPRWLRNYDAHKLGSTTNDKEIH